MTKIITNQQSRVIGIFFGIRYSVPVYTDTKNVSAFRYLYRYRIPKYDDFGVFSGIYKKYKKSLLKDFIRFQAPKHLLKTSIYIFQTFANLFYHLFSKPYIIISCKLRPIILNKLPLCFRNQAERYLPMERDRIEILKKSLSALQFAMLEKLILTAVINNQ